MQELKRLYIICYVNIKKEDKEEIYTKQNLHDTTGYIYSIISLKSMKTLIETPFYKLPS